MKKRVCFFLIRGEPMTQTEPDKRGRIICFIMMMAGLISFFSGHGVGRADTFPVIVEAKNHAILSASREGALIKFGVDMGDRVKKGDFLGMLFHKDLIVEKKRREAKMAYWKKRTAEISSLNRSGFASNEEMERAKMERIVNESEAEIIKIRIQRSKFYAPFDGVIVKRFVRPFEWVKSGQPVVEIYNQNRLYFVVSLPSKRALETPAGQRRRFFVPDMGAYIEATFSLSEPLVDARSNTIKTYWLIPGSENRPASRLLPGMKGVMEIPPSKSNAPLSRIK